jgi:hypothetical protein
MTDRHEGPRDADELAAAVADLGETPEDALDRIAGRNESLQQRLPGDDRSTDAELPRTEGAPGQG